MALRHAVLPVLLVILVTGRAQAQDDHLTCFKIKDPVKLDGIVDLDSPQFGLTAGCKISKAKFFCVPAEKTVVSAVDKATGLPITPLPITGPNAGDRVCYKVRCPKPYPPDTEISDQFGNRTLAKLKPGLVCAPAIMGPPPTPTPTVTPTPMPTATLGPKVVFVTSDTFDGNLSGLDGSDALCATRAATAGLSGTFKAWLSTPIASANARLTHAGAPYHLVDGTKIADDWADLLDGSLDAAFDRDENGDPQSGFAWTGSQPDATAAPFACSSWTVTLGQFGTHGLIGSVGGQWATYPDALTCVDLMHLYCIEQ